MRLRSNNSTWPEENHSFFDMYDNNFFVNIQWSKNLEEDYLELANNYYKCAYQVCINITNSQCDNSKTDMWFLACIYMFRQSMELNIKALICRTTKSKTKIQETFQKCKHNLYELFNIYISNGENYLETSELEWLQDYLSDLENIDKNSDLFRFPFDDDFLSQYRDKYIDIVDMANNILQSHLIIKKCVGKGEIINFDDIKFNKNRMPQFLQFANHGMGNCYLWDFLGSDGFHKQVVGYSNAAEFLLYDCNEISNNEKLYPILFLLRNSIELSLKRLLYKKVDYWKSEGNCYSKRKSHILYKKLWQCVRPMLEYYEDSEGAIKTNNIVDKHLKELSRIDKEGDVFRYPSTYSFDYKFDNQTIDLMNVFLYMNAIFNFLDCCNNELERREDQE